MVMVYCSFYGVPATNIIAKNTTVYTAMTRRSSPGRRSCSTVRSFIATWLNGVICPTKTHRYPATSGSSILVSLTRRRSLKGAAPTPGVGAGLPPPLPAP